MNAYEFLEMVTPSEGFLILAEPIEIKNLKTNPMKHHVFTDLDAMVAKANQLSFEHKNVFFALAGFKQEKVWNPTARNYKGEAGKWQVRTQANAGWLKALFLDLDIDPEPDAKKVNTTYTSKAEAVAAMRAMGLKLGMPAPMVIDSGGGIHVYWTFTTDIPAADWLPVAEKFKAICQQEHLKIDPAIPADSARVLRVLGCPNLKRDYARPVALISEGRGAVEFEKIEDIIHAYEKTYGLVQMPKRSVGMNPALGAPYGGDSNIFKVYDPIDFGAVSFACAALGGQVAVRGAGAKEPLWHTMLGLAKHATANVQEAMLAVSDGHHEFSLMTMTQKAERWSFGPSKCDRIHDADPATCEACPHWGKITSPAQLGHAIVASPTPKIELVNEATGEIEVVQLPDPPFPYARKGSKIVKQVTDKDGNKDYPEVCPNDLYPVRILRHTNQGEVTERTVWRVHAARMKPVDIELQQSMIGEERSLQKFLYNSGIYATPFQVKETQGYMSAYLKKLASEQDRERIYDRLGWQGERHNEGFVVGQRIVHMDGSTIKCNVNAHVTNATKNGLDTAGTFEAWKDNMDFYQGDTYRGHRFFLYVALGAPIFHMTGHKGMMLNACGASGRGKTTCLDACGSIWGAPDALRINGNPNGSTTNALFNLIGTYHSLPVLLDEITARDEEDMGEFALNISQGRGKERMKGSEHDGKPSTWETPILTTANNDVVARIFAKRKDAQPHMMRVVSVDFYLPDLSPAAVNRANRFAQSLKVNHGHAGLKFMQFVAANYDKVQAKVTKNMEAVNLAMGASPHERIWIAAIVTALTAGQIAAHLGLWDFPWQSDYKWMTEHITGMREAHEENATSPMETLSEFLSAHIDNMLVLSPKSATNLDNIALRPHRSLQIRHELDKQLMYISRASMQEYLLETKQSMKEIEKELVQSGVILDRSKHKVMGADTSFTGGQVRCWLINTATLGPAVNVLVQNAIAGQNVVPLRPTGT
jgi:hypothetical protein